MANSDCNMLKCDIMFCSSPKAFRWYLCLFVGIGVEKSAVWRRPGFQGTPRRGSSKLSELRLGVMIFEPQQTLQQPPRQTATPTRRG